MELSSANNFPCLLWVGDHWQKVKGMARYFDSQMTIGQRTNGENKECKRPKLNLTAVYWLLELTSPTIGASAKSQLVKKQWVY